MKLRIKGNSVRLRLTQAEVLQFAEQGRVDEMTHFPSGIAFGYSLQCSRVEEVSASFPAGRVVVNVPEAAAHQWTSSEDVGIEARLENGTKDGFHVLIEKDFQCMQPRPHEDESDNFPNPLASA